MLHVVIAVPCYNEADRLDPAAFRRFACSQPGFRLLMVNDGSTDATAAMLDELAADTAGIQALHLAPNGGKAEAVRRGILAACHSDADFVGFLDADLATPLEELPRFTDVLHRRPEIDIVLGSRQRLLGRNIRRGKLRGWLGRSFAAVASRVIRLPLCDTQCGAKVFRVNEVVRQVFSEPFASRWIFDVELLARLKLAYAASGRGNLADAVYELPLEQWYEVPGSKLKGSDFLTAVAELAGIARRYSPGRTQVSAPQSRESQPLSPPVLLRLPQTHDAVTARQSADTQSRKPEIVPLRPRAASSTMDDRAREAA